MFFSICDESPWSIEKVAKTVFIMKTLKIEVVLEISLTKNFGQFFIHELTYTKQLSNKHIST